MFSLPAFWWGSVPHCLSKPLYLGGARSDVDMALWMNQLTLYGVMEITVTIMQRGV